MNLRESDETQGRGFKDAAPPVEELMQRAALHGQAIFTCSNCKQVKIAEPKNLASKAGRLLCQECQAIEDSRAEMDLPGFATHERRMMLNPFHEWVIAKRQKIEVRLHNGREQLREWSLFAGAAFNSAEDAKNAQGQPVVMVSPTVWDFAGLALQVMECEKQLQLLNAYYPTAANRTSDVMFAMTDGNESAVRELWDWFMDEQAAGFED